MRTPCLPAPPTPPASSPVTVILAALIALTVSGCVGLQQYHRKAPPSLADPATMECVVGEADVPGDGWKCADAYFENRKEYLLGFVEFDDLGWAWDKNQQDELLRAIDGVTETQDALIVVFAHGWKHNAGTCDNNVTCFRATLEQLYRTEQALAEPGKARRIIGVYVAWRGDSAKGKLLRQTTFYGRKQTAHKVGSGAVTELLVRLKEARRQRHSRVAAQGGKSNTRLVVVGHSFGGALVYSATSQLIVERLAVSAAFEDEVQGFADLVVLVNPAFEAALYQPLHQAVLDRAARKHSDGEIGFEEDQKPVLAIITSQGDSATGKAFPLGRWFSAKLFDDYRTDGDKSLQQQANQKAVGHFAPFRTHFLNSKASTPPVAKPDTRRDKQCLCPYVFPSGEMTANEQVALSDNVQQLYRDRRNREPILEFPTSTLVWEQNKGEHQTPYNSPIMVISTQPTIIARHSDIYQAAFVDFLRYLIMLTGDEEAYAYSGKGG